jgi:competence protein ComEA
MLAGSSPPDAPRPRLRIGIGAAVVLVIVVLVVAVLLSALSPRGSTQVLTGASDGAGGGAVDASDAGSSESGASVRSGAGVILVHVLGAVARPGLYELHDGDRIVDAVAAAGGFTEAADQTQQNLAKVLADGEQLYVPAVGELPPPLPPAAGGGAGGGGTVAADGIVNLNTADLTALETLPRIGPATAQKILDYRQENGTFAQVDDLMNVTGIGQKTFDGLRDRITV